MTSDLQHPPTASASAAPSSHASWSLGSALSGLAIVGFICTSIYAKLNPVQGGEAVLRAAQGAETQKPDPAKGGKGKKKQPQETVKSSVKGPVPGTGKRLDFHELATIIDDLVSKRMAAEGFKPSPRSDDAEFLR